MYFIPEELIVLNINNQKIFARPITSEQAAEKEQSKEPTTNPAKKCETKHSENNEIPEADNLSPIVQEPADSPARLKVTAT